LRESLKLAPEIGRMIVSLEPGSPAEKAGLLIGDILVALEGKPVSDSDDLPTYLTSEQIGKALKASLVRGGALTEATIIVGERPAAQGSRFGGRGGGRHRWHSRGR
jgi:S1-C subfamily serine protease